MQSNVMVAALVDVRGILMKDVGTERIPIPLGFAFCQHIAERWAIALSWDQKKDADLRNFILLNGLTREQVSYIHCFDGVGDRFSAHLSAQRALGHVAFVLTASPIVASQAVSVGTPALLFTHPAYAREEFRPDAHRTVRHWDEMVEELTTQRLLRLADERFNEPA